MRFFKRFFLIVFLFFLYIIISNGLRFYPYIESSPVAEWMDQIPEAVETFQSLDNHSELLEMMDEPIPQVETAVQESTSEFPETDSPVAAIQESHEASMHEAEFERLHQQTLQEISDLAKEFKEDMADQSNALSQSMLLLKYERKAREFEENVDERFDHFLENMKENTDEKEWSRLEKKYTIKYQRAKRELVEKVMERANELVAEDRSE